VFLEGDGEKPDIISSSLTKLKEEKLLKVLKETRELQGDIFPTSKE